MSSLPRSLYLLAALALAPGWSALSAAAVQSKDARPQTPKTHTAGRHAPGSEKLSSEDQTTLNAALLAYNAGNLGPAKGPLLQLAARYPGQAEIQSAAGMVLAESGDSAGAIPYLRQALDLEPGNSALAANLAVLYLQENEPAKATPLLEEACRRDPANAEDRLALAHALLQTHRSGEAAQAFAAASRISTAGNVAGADAADLHHDWALALMEAGRTAEAKQVLLAAADADRSAPVQELLGEVEEKLGDYESAAGSFRRAAEIDPSEPNLNAYGNEMLRHWTFAPAIQIFRFAVQKFPQSSRLQMGLGVALFGSNQFAAAAGVFQGMVARDASNTAAADLLGRSCSAQSGAPEAACASLLTLARQHPGNAPLALYAAITLLHQSSEAQQLSEVQELLRQALRADPRLPEAWYEMGELQQTRGDWQASATSLEHAIALRPAYAEAHYRLSRAYAHTGRHGEAQQQIALQQQSSGQEKAAQERRMREVMVFLTNSH